MISENDKIQLKKMVEANNASDHTNKIRENKHSGEIRRCVLYICEKKRLGLSKSMLEAAVELECRFLIIHYFEIYNMILKVDDITVLIRLIDVLEKIESGECDQHEGSVFVGQLLKEIYIDGVLRETKQPEVAHVKPLNITWSSFKS